MISAIQDEINNNFKELIDINKFQKFAIQKINEGQKKIMSKVI